MRNVVRGRIPVYRRLLSAASAAALSLGLAAGAVVAQGLPPHGHMLVLGVEGTQEAFTYRKCVDLANNQALGLHVHHAHLHRGTAGEALFAHAGHVAIPTAPLSPIRDCAHLAELFGPPTG